VVFRYLILPQELPSAVSTTMSAISVVFGGIFAVRQTFRSKYKRFRIVLMDPRIQPDTFD
jgi:hypothetical protein